MCGIYGLLGRSSLTAVLEKLRRLQHRGRESFGVCYNNFELYKQLGEIKVGEEEAEIWRALGHTRYTTSKKTENRIKECQPFIADGFALVHNGNLPNPQELINEFNLEVTTDSDTEVLVELIRRRRNEYGNLKDALVWLINRVEGAYSLLVMAEEGIYGVRDRFGVRPLWWSNGCFASETYALELPAEEVDNGQLVIDRGRGKLESLYKRRGPGKVCSFEYIYFMNHASDGVNWIRERIGRLLGRDEETVIPQAKVVCIPNTAIPNARGFAKEVGLPFMRDWIIKEKDCGRTFIMPDAKMRAEYCDRKFAFSEEMIGQVIYLIDDSIVRGTTMRKTIKNLRAFGVREIHVRIASPPVVAGCYYGIDLPDPTKLAVYQAPIEADSLRYLKLEQLKSVLGDDSCTHCFDRKLLW